MIATIEKYNTNIEQTYLRLLDELKEECQNVINLINSLTAATMSEDEQAELLGELYASLIHLTFHSTEMENAIDDGKLDGMV
ncbi:MAG TPA: hypothetical protein VJL89_06280 [Thermodesulfovibrionia bacterium]|nr:hypothetical protein [Thermodesulfovibrionia bacterium]